MEATSFYEYEVRHVEEEDLANKACKEAGSGTKLPLGGLICDTLLPCMQGAPFFSKSSTYSNHLIFVLVCCVIFVFVLKSG